MVVKSNPPKLVLILYGAFLLLYLGCSFRVLYLFITQSSISMLFVFVVSTVLTYVFIRSLYSYYFKIKFTDKYMDYSSLNVRKRIRYKDIERIYHQKIAIKHGYTYKLKIKLKSKSVHLSLLYLDKKKAQQLMVVTREKTGMRFSHNKGFL